MQDYYQLVPSKQNNRSLWGMALIAFCWTTSSMMVFSILAPFLCYEFHATYKDIGNLEGWANAAAFLAKFASGIVTDLIKSRTGVLAVGSFLTAGCKFLFAISSTLLMVNAARILDRFSKGVRAAPADALLADLSPQNNRGVAYGLRQTSMTIGAVVGTLAAWVLTAQTNNNYRAVMYCAIIPAACALVIQIFFVRQPKLENVSMHPKQNSSKKSFHIREVFQMPLSFWIMLLFINILMFARFSENFVVLRAMELGWMKERLPFVLGTMNVVHAIFAFPMGRIADQWGHAHIMGLGLFILMCANTIIIFATMHTWLYLALVLIGIELSMTQGVIKSLVSQTIPKSLRGTGFSLIALTTSASLLYSNRIAGGLAHHFNTTQATFVGGFIAATITLAFLLAINKKLATIKE